MTSNSETPVEDATVTEPPVVTTPKGRVTKVGHYDQETGAFTIA